MDKPISLGMFNVLPHLTPAFFEYSLRLENYRWDHPYMGASYAKYFGISVALSPLVRILGLFIVLNLCTYLMNKGGFLPLLSHHIAEVLLMVPCVKNKTPSYLFLGRLDTRARSSSPLVAGGDIGPVDVNLWAWEVVRYKYKFFKAEEHDVSNKEKR